MPQSHVAHHHGALLKVILETALLNMEEKLRGSEIAIQAGADFIKTSTGFGGGGATLADVALMRGVAGGRCGVKASGGIRTLADVRALLEAGANRIGASGLGRRSCANWERSKDMGLSVSSISVALTPAVELILVSMFPRPLLVRQLLTPKYHRRTEVATTLHRFQLTTVT